MPKFQENLKNFLGLSLVGETITMVATLKDFERLEARLGHGCSVQITGQLVQSYNYVIYIYIYIVGNQSYLILTPTRGHPRVLFK